MSARKDFAPEFKDQAVRFVLEEVEPDESRKHACDRLTPKLSVKAVTLYNLVMQSAPPKARLSAPPGSLEELRARSPRCARRTVRSRCQRGIRPLRGNFNFSTPPLRRPMIGNGPCRDGAKTT